MVWDYAKIIQSDNVYLGVKINVSMAVTKLLNSIFQQECGKILLGNNLTKSFYDRYKVEKCECALYRSEEMVVVLGIMDYREYDLGGNYRKLSLIFTDLLITL